jgi:hypothetical protein
MAFEIGIKSFKKMAVFLMGPYYAAKKVFDF